MRLVIVAFFALSLWAQAPAPEILTPISGQIDRAVFFWTEAPVSCAISKEQARLSRWGDSDSWGVIGSLVGLKIQLPKGTPHSQVMRCVSEIHDSEVTQNWLSHWSVDAKHLKAKTKHLWEIWIGEDLDCFLPMVGGEK